MIGKKLGIFVFSFNRAEYLHNCIDSVERTNNIGSNIYVIDDDSDDPATINFLRHISLKPNIHVRCSKAVSLEAKTGGLYAAMNLAIEIAALENFEYALFLQDDMQLVRHLTKEDLVRFDSYFDANQDSIQLSLCFFSKSDLDGTLDQFRVDQSGVAWLRQDIYERGKTFFSDVGLFHVSRVKERLGSFSIGEHINAQRCAELKIKRGVYRAPLMHWLPFPRSFRNKRKTILGRCLEAFLGSGFYPFELIPQTESAHRLKTLSDRDLILEYAVSCRRVPNSIYWTGVGGLDQVYGRGGWRLAIFRWLKLAKSLLRK